MTGRLKGSFKRRFEASSDGVVEGGSAGTNSFLQRVVGGSPQTLLNSARLTQ
jgi:hypothetical protein